MGLLLFLVQLSMGSSTLIAELEVHGNAAPVDMMDIQTLDQYHVRVYEIDEEAGIWKPPIRYALQNYN